MDFRLLGSLEIWEGSGQIEISGVKRRAVLALLVLHANEVVGKDRLIDAVWGEKAPQSAAASLHNHISRLRKSLGPDVVVTRAWGYVLRVEPQQVDLHRFQRLLEDAEPLPAKERSTKLAEALALWRGPALADVASEPGLAGEAARLNELRLAALEARIDADLELGHATKLMGELEGLIADHPLRERLRGQLILALYRAGRQAEALEVYRETRRLLAEELGLEPSPDLRELERAILRHDPSLAAAVVEREPEPVPTASDRSSSRWRWPRSPLIALSFVLLAGGGVAAAVMAATSGQPRDETIYAGVASPAERTVTAATSTPAQTQRSSTTTPQTSGKTTATNDGSSAVEQGGAKLVAATRPTTHKHSGSRSSGGRRSSTAPGSTTSSQAHHRRGTTKPATAKPVTPANVYVLADDFSGSAVNPQTWNESSFGDGVQSVQQNGMLQFSVASNVSYQKVGSIGAVDEHYGTTCYLKGNFDVRVGFKLETWPAGDGVLVSLGVYFAPPHEDLVSVSRAGASAASDRGRPFASEGYYTWMQGYDGSVPSQSKSGVLRITRENGRLVAYVRARHGWREVGPAGSAPWPASPVLMLAAHPSDFGNQAASAAFDHFRATAAGVKCPPGTPQPPRRTLRG